MRLKGRRSLMIVLMAFCLVGCHREALRPNRPKDGGVLGIVGYATYYTRASSSGVTAYGEPYVEWAYTCARPNRLEYGMWWVVCGRATQRCVEVRVNDLGPGLRAQHRGVIVDLTPAGFHDVCGPLKLGRCQVYLIPGTPSFGAPTKPPKKHR